MERPSREARESIAEPVSAPPSANPRQRWRLVLAREPGAPELSGRELSDAWEAAVEAAGLPMFCPPGRSRARVAFGAPVPARMALECELADVILTEMVPAWSMREALSREVLAGWRLVDLFDVWLGSPTLAAQVAGADYRIEVDGVDPAAARIAAGSMLAARTLPRERAKGGTTVAYDLRPLLSDVAVLDQGPPLVVRTRTRFDPVLGTGRPEEVVAALGEAAGGTPTVRSIVRERLVLSEDMA